MHPKLDTNVAELRLPFVINKSPDSIISVSVGLYYILYSSYPSSISITTASFYVCSEVQLVIPSTPRYSYMFFFPLGT
jgi:hypothetical protein